MSVPPFQSRIVVQGHYTEDASEVYGSGEVQFRIG